MACCISSVSSLLPGLCLYQVSFKKALEAYDDVPVLRFRNLTDVFGGITDPVLQTTFDEFVGKVTSNWCCRYASIPCAWVVQCLWQGGHWSVCRGRACVWRQALQFMWRGGHGDFWAVSRQYLCEGGQEKF